MFKKNVMEGAEAGTREIRFESSFAQCHSPLFLTHLPVNLSIKANRPKKNVMEDPKMVAYL